MRKTGRDFEVSDTVQSLRRIFKAIQDYSQEVSRSFGVTGPQLWALTTIAGHEALPLGELSKKMYLHPSTVTGVVDRLEAKGYVSRDRSARDRRVVTVCLTPKGKEPGREGAQPRPGEDDTRAQETGRRRSCAQSTCP